MNQKVILMMLIIFSGCGIFSPREDFEMPDPNVKSQPLSFEGILDSTGQNFDKTGYEDVFYDSLIYQDMNSGVFRKNELVSYLQKVQLGYQKMIVKWTPKRENTIIKTDTMIFYKVEYIVNADADSITGKSDFILAKNNQWQIVKWVDYPSWSKKSIFSPYK